jgi:hypothetical protein
MFQTEVLPHRDRTEALSRILVRTELQELPARGFLRQLGSSAPWRVRGIGPAGVARAIGGETSSILTLTGPCVDRAYAT